jgi:DNA-binding IclR family transcriptional regulator
VPNTFSSRGIDLPRTAKSTKTGGLVESVEKAFEILQSVAAFRRIGVLKLSQQIELPYSTVHRLLRTLERLGYIVQSGDRSQYSLGPKVLELGTAFLDQVALREEALPFMVTLNQETRETINLVLWNGTSAICIEKMDSPESVTVQQTQVGRNEPLHSTGLGKAILAQHDPRQVAEILGHRELTRYTPNTITTLTELTQDLAATRLRGFAIDDEEGLPGIRCVASAIVDHQGAVVGAISLVAPAIRMNKRRMGELGLQVRDVAARISQRLGFNPERAIGSKFHNADAH